MLSCRQLVRICPCSTYGRSSIGESCTSISASLSDLGDLQGTIKRDNSVKDKGVLVHGQEGHAILPLSS